MLTPAIDGHLRLGGMLLRDSLGVCGEVTARVATEVASGAHVQTTCDACLSGGAACRPVWGLVD